MKSISFAHNGKVIPIATNENVLRALLVEKVPVLMACGGKGLCATCHVYVEKGAEFLAPRTKREERTLGLVHDSDKTSRLACQAKVLADGVVVRLPKGLYIEKSTDLNDLIGRRAEAPILHPVNGNIMVVEGKIITRSTVEKLAQSVDVDMNKLLNESKDLAP